MAVSTVSKVASLKDISEGKVDIMESLKMKLGYQDLIHDSEGNYKVNQVTLEKWLGQELTPKEV